VDDDHCVAIFKWQDQPKDGKIVPLANGKGSKASIMTLQFDPEGNNVYAGCVKEANVFSVAGTAIKKKKVGGFKEVESVLCQKFIGGTNWCGTQAGNIVAIKGNAVVNINKKAHEGIVNCV
jgi:hypothetical protein